MPGSLIATNAVKFVAKQVGLLDKFKSLTKARAPEAAVDANIKQEQLFEQYTAVLQALAARQPLILWLDDLHWVDPSSASLLFHLGRSLAGSRILIIGSYRAEEIALGRPGAEPGQRQQHPLQPVIAEFKRYRGDVELDLSQAMTAEGRAFVDALLDTEANALSDAFRQALYQHTGGQPLFTAELLRDMQERGVLVQDERGRWVEGTAVDWELLPARVEGVIETRVNRLEEELREALTIASVEGEQFTAEVVARRTNAFEPHWRLPGKCDFPITKKVSLPTWEVSFLERETWTKPIPSSKRRCACAVRLRIATMKATFWPTWVLWL